MFEESLFSDTISNGKNHVLSIAIDEYQNQDVAKNLKNSVFDSRNILEALQKYKIEKPIELYNNDATYDDFTKTIDNLKDKITEDDNLIVVWGGHGEVKDDDGYLIFNDSTHSDSTWLSYRDLIRRLEKISVKHLILLINSCYSAKIFEETRSGSIVSNSFIEDMKAPSRWGLVSGRNKVSDGIQGEGSPFANAIKDFLNRNEDLTVSVRNITDYVKYHIEEQGKTQNPIDGVFDNQRHENGVFYFQLKEDENVVWEKTIAKPSIESYSIFIAKFPNSQKITEAEVELKNLQKHQQELINYLKYTTSSLDKLTKNLNERNELFKSLKEDYLKYQNLLNELTIKDKIEKYWENIKYTKNILELTDFVAEYEDNSHAYLVQDYIDRAKKFRDRLKEEKKAKEYWEEINIKLKNQQDISKILGLYHLYIYEHPHSEWSKEARKQVEIIKLYKKALERYEQSEDATLLYQFQNKYRNHKFSERAKRQTDKFEKKQSKQKDAELLDELKIEKSIQNLKNFINNENNNDEIREDAIKFLETWNQEINLKLEKAKDNSDIKLLYEIFTIYKDDERVEKAKAEFEEKIITFYEKSIQDVFTEKSTEPLVHYITECSIYEEYEITKIEEAQKYLESFNIEIEMFNELKSKDGVVENDFKEYLNTYPNPIFKEEVNEEIKKLKHSQDEEMLRELCFEKQRIEDLEDYVIKFREYENFVEINNLYQKKKAEFEANDLIEKITELFNKDDREKALAMIKTFDANFSEHEKIQTIQEFKTTLNLWNQEDRDFEAIKKEVDKEEQKILRYQFLSNRNYTRRKEEVEEILNPKSIVSSKPIIGEQKNIIKPIFELPTAFYITIGILIFIGLGILIMLWSLFLKIGKN